MSQNTELGSKSTGIGRLEEREKEVLLMKIERLEACKSIVEREHTLHGGGAGGSGMWVMPTFTFSTNLGLEDIATRGRRICVIF